MCQYPHYAAKLCYTFDTITHIYLKQHHFDQMHTRLLSVQATRYFMSGLSCAWLIKGGVSIFLSLLFIGSLVSGLSEGHNRVQRAVSVSPYADLSTTWACKIVIFTKHKNTHYNSCVYILYTIYYTCIADWYDILTLLPHTRNFSCRNREPLK